MVEYAVVLACVAALGYVYFRPAAGRNNGEKGMATLNGVLTDMWDLISEKADTVIGK